MAVSLSYYPNSAVGIFGKPEGAKGICSGYVPEMERMVEAIVSVGMIGFVHCYKKPYHLALQADSPEELSDLAFKISEKLSKAGHHFSLPFDYSKVEEVKE